MISFNFYCRVPDDISSLHNEQLSLSQDRIHGILSDDDKQTMSTIACGFISNEDDASCFKKPKCEESSQSTVVASFSCAAKTSEPDFTTEILQYDDAIMEIEQTGVESTVGRPDSAETIIEEAPSQFRPVRKRKKPSSVEGDDITVKGMVKLQNKKRKQILGTDDNGGSGMQLHLSDDNIKEKVSVSLSSRLAAQKRKGEALVSTIRSLRWLESDDAAEKDPTGLRMLAGLGRRFNKSLDRRSPSISNTIKALCLTFQNVNGSDNVANKIKTLPTNLHRFLVFWYRRIQLLSQRRAEAEQWACDVRDEMLLAYSNVSSCRHSERWSKIYYSSAPPPESFNLKQDTNMLRSQGAQGLLEIARKRGIHMRARTLLEKCIDEIHEWSTSVQQLMSFKDRRHSGSDEAMNSLPTLAGLKLIISKGELLPCDRPELAYLREELKKANFWLARFQQTGLGGFAFTDGQSTTDCSVGNLQALVDESRSLLVDVGTELLAISQASRKYCLCRQPYHGNMIGCDGKYGKNTCDEWYHFQCVGLTEAQAEKLDSYVCLRCSLNQSFRNSARIVAQITNRWCGSTSYDSTAASKNRESKKSKVSFMIF